MIQYKIIGKVIGIIIIILSVLMTFPALISSIYGGDDVLCFLKSSLIVAIIGMPLALIKADRKNIGKREGYLIVTLAWIFMCSLGSLPYIIHVRDISFVNALFESASGFTTTGASIFTDIESLSPGTLFWRSLTQWVGGMGIIVFTVAIFPLLGIGGVELFVAEAPGPQSDKIHPRIKEVAKRLWLIYVGLTAVCCILLSTIGGMSFFDAINHALTTMSTGGFSTKNASIAAFPPVVHYIILSFMFVGGMNYTVIYFLFKNKWSKAWRSDEFKFYLTIVAAIILLITSIVYTTQDIGLEKALRDVAFQAVSIITTTGYISADYTAWNKTVTLIFFILLFMGACAGSTSGGIKIIRHLVFLKNSLLEFKRLIHPRAYIRLRVDGGLVRGRIITHILVFLLFYLILFIFGSVIMSMILSQDQSPFLSAIGAVATSLGNVGPAIGSVGPVDNFAHIPDIGKVFLSFLMIVGRLELFTVLILFTPYFWRSN